LFGCRDEDVILQRIFCDGVVMAAKLLIYQFLDIRVEVTSFRVSKAGRPVALEPKAIETLVFLLERRGRLVERDELLNGVWRDSFVTPNALTRIIAQLRRELDDDPKEARIIETVPTRGYRFIAEVEQLEAEPSSPASVESRTPQFIGVASIGDSQPAFGMGPAVEEFPPADIILERQDENDWKLAADQPTLEIKPPKRNISRRRWLGAAVVLALAIPAAIFYQRRADESRKPSSSQPAKSIAVLPFRQLTPAGGDEYIGVGLADALITRLSGLRQIIVRPTSAVLKFNRPEGDVVAIGRELKVTSVLDGSVQQVAEHVRVTARLINVTDGKPLWAESYDAEFKDVFQVQDAISTRIASALSLQLNEVDRQRLAKRPTANIEAYQLYLRGSYRLNRFTVEDHHRAISYFKQAIDRDPSFALAYASLGAVYGFAISSDVTDQNEARAKAEAARRQALALDPTLGDVHAVTGADEFWRLHNAQAARESFIRAMELNPNSALAYQYYAWFLTATGHFEEAKVIMRRAQDIDPLAPFIGADQAMPFYYARDYEAARAHAAQAVALDPNFWAGHFRLGEAYEGLGDYAKAAAEFERSFALQGQTDVRAMLARELALGGKREEASRILQEIASAKTLHSPNFYHIALGYLGLGAKETALEWLERARAENDGWLGWVKVDPRLDPIRGDARFAELTRALGVNKWN
jgi:TolB-like protein/DNA-binding winged helix-turn-helix (wHTH) protein/lipoprotein NlpI